MPPVPSVEWQVDFTKQNLPLGEVTDEVWRHYAIHQLVEKDGGYAYHFDPLIFRQAKVDLLNIGDVTEGLEKIKSPLALISGEKSDLCTASEVSELKARRPDLRHYLVPKAGHVPSLSDRESQKFVGDFIAASNG
jgi:pimeloyl-ACP methyl ester carboxylesterase